MPIRVLIADDHVILREGVALILDSRPEFTVISQAADGKEAVAKAKTLHPDIALLDINMPGLNGVEATRQILRHCPQTKTLMLTMYDDDDIFFEAIQAGASGYVLKGSRPTELIDALTAVANGDVYLSPPMARKLVNRLLHSHSDEEAQLINTLTDREMDVMHLLARGLTNREIAAQLTISPSTVQTHRTHIMQKLELNNRSELIRFAIRHNLLRE